MPKSKKQRDPMKVLYEQYIVDSEGKKTAVILPIGRYKQLLEDLHDIAVVAERRNEKPMGLEEVKKRLKKDGLL